MKKTHFFVMLVIFFCLNFGLSGLAQNKKPDSENNKKPYFQYEMPVYGLSNQAEIKKLQDFFYSKEGIVFVNINPKTFYCIVITKNYITIDNVIDILRKENTKTDYHKSKELSQIEADDLMKKLDSSK